jgi:hypothetical protein
MLGPVPPGIRIRRMKSGVFMADSLPLRRCLRLAARFLTGLAVGLFLAGTLPTSLQAQSKRATKRDDSPGGKPADYTSPHFLLHTDLSSAEAKELLTRLETMLGLISQYWGKPPSGVIECYVVKELGNWPEGSIPSDRGRAQIEAGAGVTITERLTQGNRFLAKAVVYASADRSTPQHEAVHAYCGQTFGRTGPVWYSEGMAEMGAYWKKGDSAVACQKEIVQYLKSAEPKSLNAIVNGEEFTGDSWQNYAWRWALCHVLANNPNYADRFRPLGLGLLTDQSVTFEQVYGAMATDICFEYLFFLKHFDVGYRADLCAFDWKKKFKPLRVGTITTPVPANRGWQATGIVVAQGDHLDYAAEGTWKLTKTGAAVSADGDTGQGNLVAMVMKDFSLEGSLRLEEYLSEPIDLGSYGTFAAPQDGKLYLRCSDAWNELADNSGSIKVKLKKTGEGPPLARPKGK